MNITLAFMAQQLRNVAQVWGTSTVTVEHVTGRDDYAEPVYGTPVTFTDARIEGKVQMERRAQSETLIGAEVIHLDSDGTPDTFNPDDRVTLPDGSTRLVLRVEVIAVGDETVETVLYMWRGG